MCFLVWYGIHLPPLLLLLPLRYLFVSRQEETERRGVEYPRSRANKKLGSRSWKVLDTRVFVRVLSQERSCAILHNWEEEKEVEGRRPLLRAMLHSGNANPPIVHSHAQTCTFYTLLVLVVSHQAKHANRTQQRLYLTPLKRFPASLLIAACLDGCLDG